jgi:hypothetical protein
MLGGPGGRLVVWMDMLVGNPDSLLSIVGGSNLGFWWITEAGLKLEEPSIELGGESRGGILLPAPLEERPRDFLSGIWLLARLSRYEFWKLES